MDITNGMIQWLANGNRGVSSETLFTHLTGIEAGKYRDHPHDPSDFMRCERLLMQCPELRDELHRMAELGPVWAALVADWDVIVALVNAESPKWMTACARAPKAYQRICDIIAKARREAAESVAV